MKKQAYEIFGWVGVIAVLTGYMLVSLGILSGNSAVYHFMMLIGSLFVAVISLKKRSLQPAVLNVLFACFASIALARILL